MVSRASKGVDISRTLKVRYLLVRYLFEAFFTNLPELTSDIHLFTIRLTNGRSFEITEGYC